MEKKIEEQLKRLPKYIEDSGNKYFLEPGIIGDDFDVVVIDYVDNKSMYRDLLFSVENIDTTPRICSCPLWCCRKIVLHYEENKYYNPRLL